MSEVSINKRKYWKCHYCWKKFKGLPQKLFKHFEEKHQGKKIIIERLE